MDDQDSTDLPARQAPPAPELAAEARAFTAEIGAMLDRSETGPDMLQFTIRVPREFALMAAWVMFREDMRRDGVPTVLPRPVRLHLDGGQRSRDWQRAKAYFERAIFREFDTDYTNLLMETHPLLYPLAPASSPAIGPSETMDDDEIPF